MTYEQNVSRLGARAGTAIEGLYTRHLAGDFTAAEFQSMAATLVSQVNAKGAVIAELTLGGYGGGLISTPVQDVSERVMEALDTILGSDLDTAMQLRRLANNEAINSASSAFSEAIKQSPDVEGYTRGVESDACELCQWLNKDDFVFPAAQEMSTHPGCLCHPIPAMIPNRSR